MKTLTHIKIVLEVTILGLFLVLLLHVWRRRGHEHALSVLANKP